MASPQTDNGFTRVANELYEEILRRNFSKRQQNMLLFIMRLSYGCRRKYCEIPKFNQFELAGVDKSDVKKELMYLRDCKVIDWADDVIKYAINKNYDLWQVNPSKGFNREKLNELISLNLKNKKVGELPTKNVGELPTNNDIEVSAEVGKIPTDIEELVGKILTEQLAKHQLLNPSNLTESKREDTPKESIKESIKENKDIYIPVFEHWNSKKIIVHRKANAKMISHINARLDDYELKEVLEAIDNYKKILESDEYFFTYTWTLEDFMSPNRFVKFLTASKPFDNYRNKFTQNKRTGVAKQIANESELDFSE